MSQSYTGAARDAIVEGVGLILFCFLCTAKFWYTSTSMSCTHSNGCCCCQNRTYNLVLKQQKREESARAKVVWGPLKLCTGIQPACEPCCCSCPASSPCVTTGKRNTKFQLISMCYFISTFSTSRDVDIFELVYLVWDLRHLSWPGVQQCEVVLSTYYLHGVLLYNFLFAFHLSITVQI